MAKQPFAIIGASGKIGFVLTEELLKKGNQVRALGRDKNKLQKLKEKGAAIFSFPFEDTISLIEFVKGCHGVFSFLPPAYENDDFEGYQNKVGEAIQQAVQKTNISHVLNLSSLGAELPAGTGPIKGLHRQEQRLNSIPNLNVLHLRPSSFMENLFWSLPLIKTMGIIGSTLKPDLPIPMVATKDIGGKAGELLDGLKFKGQNIFDFVGPRPVSMSEATKIIGKAIGKSDLHYVQFSPTEAEKGMISTGMKPKLVKLMLEMNQATNEGKIHPTQQIIAEHKGKTTIEEFAKTFAEKFQEEQKRATAKRR